MGLCDGRVCIVTGAGRGIGREYALMLAAEGAKVVIADRKRASRIKGDLGVPVLVIEDAHQFDRQVADVRPAVRREAVRYA